MGNGDKNTKKDMASNILEDALGGVNIPNIEPLSLADELLEEDKGQKIDETDNGSLEAFCSRYFKSNGNSDVKRNNTALNSDLMDKLKTVLFYLDPKCALSNYIENILLDHLERNKELINTTVANRFNSKVI